MTLLSRESAMAPGGQRLAASVSGVSLAVLGGKGRVEEEDKQEEASKQAFKD